MSQIHKKKILIVDDEPSVRQVLRRTLSKSYIVLEAEDGEEAIDMARKEKPDLVLMDIMMPKMDGIEATRILKADPGTRNIPILALTSYAMKGDKEKILEAGCDGYMTKPFDIRNLLKKVAEYLSG